MIEIDAAARERLREAANTLRFLAVDMVQRANSGHPGMPMGMADVAALLWTQVLCHDPSDPSWPDRDRFVLSNGHGSALLYGLLHLSGYDLPLEQLRAFRQLGSLTPGHPERGHTPGVETTTGPLGQGLANAVGMALAERWLGERYNRPEHSVVDHFTYAFVGDGCLMEGISHEAAALAGHLGLGKLIVFFDDNGISIDGPVALTSSEKVLSRFTAYGWHTISVDGHDPAEVAGAVQRAQEEGRRPSLIACRTHIGYGSPSRQDTAKAHGEPLGGDEVRAAKQALGWPVEPDFLVPEPARELFAAQAARGAEQRRSWQQRRADYAKAYPKEAAELEAALGGELPPGWIDALPRFTAGQSVATRAASGGVLSALAGQLPTLIGGSADLTPSNNTRPRNAPALTHQEFSGTYVHFGVREHAMGAVLNGMTLHGGVRPYGGTFMVFSDYMRPPMRLAAMMRIPTLFVFTHDSVGVGEDGPTHQPVEHLMAMRLIPGLTVLRPADANETVFAWRAALQRQGPSAICLSRQSLPVLDRSPLGSAQETLRGAYVLSEPQDPELLLLATGSEVHLALAAQDLLAQDGVRARVVSMPSWEIFEEQDAAYRDQVLPPGIRARVAIEAGASLGWHRYTGDCGEIVGLDRFGLSAPGPEAFAALGFTVEAVVEAARRSLARSARLPA